MARDFGRGLPAIILALQKAYEYTATTPLPGTPASDEGPAEETHF